VDEFAEVSDDGQQKPKKLVPFQSRYSDTDGEETTEQCRARVVCMHVMFLLMQALMHLFLIWQLLTINFLSVNY